MKFPFDLMLLHYKLTMSTKRLNLIPAVFLAFILVLTNLGSEAQSLYLPQGNKHQAFLELLEIMLQKNPELNIASARSIARHAAVDIAGMEDSSSGNPTLKLSLVDQDNIQSLFRNNAEWV